MTSRFFNFSFISLLAFFLLLQSESLLAKQKIPCSLDSLVDFPACWKMTPDDFEKKFTKGKTKFFKWLTVDKNRAKIINKQYSNASVVLSLFDGALHVEEVIVDFNEGKLNLVTFSIYNRGDSGTISKEDFKKSYMLCGKSMSAKIKSHPSKKKANKSQGFQTEGFSWYSRHTLALLEHNHDAIKEAKPEFLRLRVARKGATGGLAASMNNNRGGAAIKFSALKKSVTKDDKGNVFIKGIPMVDQGSKGYCAVASVQRIFELFGIGADMHQIAEIANADPRRGTDSIAMAKELDKIDHFFKTRLKIIGMLSSSGKLAKINPKKGKLLVGPPLTNKKIKKAICDNIDDGLPILWSLQLGRYPEIPKLHQQTSGGHMRLIIGYNEKDQTFIFSDSWGAGHEFKKMKMEYFYKATNGLFTLKPTTN